MFIDTAAGDGDMNVGMPVESPAVGVDRAENTDIQSALAGGIQQIIDGQTAEVVEQPAVNLKQGPQRIGEGEDQVYPVAVRQTVELRGNLQVSGLFPTGWAGAAVAGVGDIFYMLAAGIIAAIFLHASDAGAAGQHFCNRFDLDITQTARVEKRSPALVSSEQLFERSRAETGNHGTD